MGQRTPDAPQVVVVEVTSQRRGVARWRPAAAIGAIGAVAAAVAVWLGGASAQHRDPVAARGPAGVAAAYGYRLGCLTVTILPADRTYARADLSHVAGCGRTTGYAPAIFHYVAGRWQLVPDAIGYMCLAGAVPDVVERGLHLCVGPIGPSCARIATPGQGRPAATLGWPCAKLPKISGVV